MDKAIIAVYLQSDHQKCILHQIRNSIKHVNHKDMKAVRIELNTIYTAKAEISGKTEPDNFIQNLGSKYKYNGKFWEKNWAELSTFW